MTSGAIILGIIALSVLLIGFLASCVFGVWMLWSRGRARTVDLDELERDLQLMQTERAAREVWYAKAESRGLPLRRVMYVLQRFFELLIMPCLLPIFLAQRVEAALDARKRRRNNPP